MTDIATASTNKLDNWNDSGPWYEDVLLDVLLTPAPRRLGNINPSGDIGNGRETSDRTPSPCAKRLGMIALVLAVACMARVNLGSILGSLTLQAMEPSRIAPLRKFAYNASKAALNMFTIHLAAELKDTNIKVNS